MLKKYFKKYVTVSFVLVLLFFVPRFTFAKNTNLTISPLVIDASGEIGGLLEYTINIKNNESFKATIYPIVRDFYSKKSKDAVDKSINGSMSPFEWIKIQRGVIKIDSGDNVDVPLKIDIKNNVVPGDYSAKIYFPSARNRSDAERYIENFNEPEVVVNIKISDNIVKNAEIVDFKAKKVFFIKNPIELSFVYKNIGNREMNPIGDLSIYNNRNQEIQTIDLENQLSKILVNEERKVSIKLNDVSGFGKYKAKLRLDYNGKTKNLQDVVYFTFLPWKKIIILFVLLLIILLFISFKVFKSKKIEYYVNDNTSKTKEHTVNLRRDL